MPSQSRITDIASELENFLDSNEDDLSPNMFKALEDVAETIDEQVGNLHQEIAELREEKEDLKARIAELEASS